MTYLGKVYSYNEPYREQTVNILLSDAQGVRRKDYFKSNRKYLAK